MYFNDVLKQYPSHVVVMKMINIGREEVGIDIGTLIDWSHKIKDDYVLQSNQAASSLAAGAQGEVADLMKELIRKITALELKAQRNTTQLGMVHESILSSPIAPSKHAVHTTGVHSGSEEEFLENAGAKTLAGARKNISQITSSFDKMKNASRATAGGTKVSSIGNEGMSISDCMEYFLDKGKFKNASSKAVIKLWTIDNVDGRNNAHVKRALTLCSLLMTDEQFQALQGLDKSTKAEEKKKVVKSISDAVFDEYKQLLKLKKPENKIRGIGNQLLTKMKEVDGFNNNPMDVSGLMEKLKRERENDDGEMDTGVKSTTTTTKKKKRKH